MAAKLVGRPFPHRQARVARTLPATNDTLQALVLATR
jgi:hypothetical protein